VNQSRDSKLTVTPFHWKFLPLVTIGIILINAIRLPIGYKNFWAEDGRLFYQEALDNPFPLELTEPRGGYLNLIAALIGRLISFASLSMAPIVNFIICCTIFAIMVVILFAVSGHIIESIIFRIIFSLLPVFIPISGFESLVVSSQLHFFLPFICLNLLLTESINHQLPKAISTIFVLFSCLSDPMSIFILFGLLFARLFQSIVGLEFRVAKLRFFIFCMIIQSIVTLLFLDRGGRDFEHSIGYAKTGYLFLDRVVGSALIPNWGFVNGNEFTDESQSKYIVRAILAISLLMLVTIIARLAKLNQVRATFVIVFGLSGTLYWVAGSLAFNPEPRYAIYPSMCLAASVLIILDSLIATRGPAKFRFRARVLVASYSMLILAFSWEPSALRSSGVSWQHGLTIARTACLNSSNRTADVEILPQIDGWSVKIPCEKFEKSTNAN
jgi:hypothetical protein